MRSLIGSSSLMALIVAASVAGFAASAFADPPTQVGRFAYIEGAVSLHGSGSDQNAPDQNQWAPAAVNFPVVAGDALWADTSSRAEIDIGPAIVRMDSLTQVDVAYLDDQATQLQLDQGDINVRLAAIPPNGFSIHTASGDIYLTQPGSYDINAGPPPSGSPAGGIPPGQIVATVFQGALQINASGSSLQLQPGQTVVLSGNPPSFTMAQAAPTALDSWAQARDRRAAASNALRYVSPQMTGYEVLDDYGQWSTDPTYGAVWYPTNVASDWQPYRVGHWAYVAPWGWTWIDDAPWGFAPFHYGRWAPVNGRWGWYPGQRVAHPVYAPALVAFLGGTGLLFAISVGGGPAIGWVPLAPNEGYRPWYAVSRNYTRTVNAGNVRNGAAADNNGRFANVNHAVVVRVSAFTSAQPVARASLRVTPDRLAGAQRTTNLAAIRPAAAALAPNPAHAHGAPPHAPAVRPVRVVPAAEALRPPPRLPAARITPAAAPAAARAPAQVPGSAALVPPAAPVRPENARPDTAHPFPSHPPEGARPEGAGPEAGRPEARPPVATPSAAPQVAPAARPESTGPGAVHPFPQHPPEGARPEAARPEGARPEARPQVTIPPAVPQAAPAQPAARPAPPVVPEVARPVPPHPPEAARPPEAPRPETRPEVRPQVAPHVEAPRVEAPHVAAPAPHPPEAPRPAPRPEAPRPEAPHAAPPPAPQAVHPPEPPKQPQPDEKK